MHPANDRAYGPQEFGCECDGPAAAARPEPVTRVKSRAIEDVCVYGLGATGQLIVDTLLDSGSGRLRFIVDRAKCGKSYRNIPVLSPSELQTMRALDKSNCLIGLHNHYVDIGKLYDELSGVGFKKIYSIGNCSELGIHIDLPNGYWWDPDFRLDRHKEQLREVSQLLADDKSREILDAIVRYRESGDIRTCPAPSSFDEYTPLDLPRYKDPLRLIDCGAYTGVAIDKFIAADYRLESFVAFEPDLRNYEKLCNRDFGAASAACLPLGVWSSGTQLRFRNQGTMGSAVSDDGDTVIQCVSIDGALKNFHPNLIKLDIEGAEIEALRGAKATIAARKPNLCVSLYHKPTHLFEIPLLLQAWNPQYRFHIRVHEFNTFGVVLYCFNEDLVQPRPCAAGASLP